jgi:hypothetical protein
MWVIFDERPSIWQIQPAVNNIVHPRKTCLKDIVVAVKRIPVPENISRLRGVVIDQKVRL